MEAYAAGQRRFGENRPQDLSSKARALPSDIEWHFLGHLQTNKLKMVLPHAALIHSIDSLHLLDAVNKWSLDNGRRTGVLLEVHVGQELTKQGFSPEQILPLLERIASEPDKYWGINLCGLMGMASHTEDESRIRADFSVMQDLFLRAREELGEVFPSFRELSIGMSGDWRIALDYGATMVRIGTAIFGAPQS